MCELYQGAWVEGCPELSSSSLTELSSSSSFEAPSSSSSPSSSSYALVGIPLDVTNTKDCYFDLVDGELYQVRATSAEPYFTVDFNADARVGACVLYINGAVAQSDPEFISEPLELPLGTTLQTQGCMQILLGYPNGVKCASM
jgi:hypothetical protein